MNFPKFKAGDCDYWLGEAFTQFINGVIKGLGAGGVAGIGTGGASGAEQFHHWPWWIHALIGAGFFLLTACGNGMKQVVVWQDTHPFPNPWPKPPAPPPTPNP